mmetsp:Transcript_10299/g.28413  ORF Transcript_10299/g.28413 Transcript_10299/m.28413 type:complete len:675 (+) Transcript_10299:294-2318(+)
MNTKDYVYSWHLSLRVDRPVEGCAMRPHAYMYGKKLDEREYESKSNQPHTKVMKEPPPSHEFSYRWFRGPLHEVCAFQECPRRLSFSPHDWSHHALGGTDCALQCVSQQSSLYKRIYCNSQCFVDAWKTQYTMPKEMLLRTGGGAGNANSNSRAGTPMRSRAGSFDSSDEVLYPDETGSTRSNGSRSPGPPMDGVGGGTLQLPGNAKNGGASNNSNNSNNNPSTPRGFVGGYNTNSNNNNSTGGNDSHDYHYTDYNAGDDWIEISRDQLLMPGPDDVGRKLKLEAAAYSMETGELLMSRVVKTDVVLSRAPDPKKRNLVTAKGAATANNAGPRFRVATYNVLAEIYATGQQYPYCDFWALSWDYRFQNILREIMDASPEVLCLQEIQADHYENHIYAALSEAGYEGVFKQKTRQSMGLAGKVDGCALFWRRSKFHLVESYSIEFNELAQRQCQQVLGMNSRGDEGIAFMNRLSKDNVAQLVVLEFIQPQTRTSRDITQVCIANTHLYSNKDFPDVKLWQTWQLLQELESFVMSRGTNLPLIICGDFNSTPDTAVYDLLARQSVHPGHPDVNVTTGDDHPNILPDAMNITHSFQLGSAYQTVLGDEPWVTNFTLNFKGVLDYIWYSAQNLRPLSAAPIPDEANLTKHGEALPSTEYSSDHVMLISDLQVISNGNR